MGTFLVAFLPTEYLTKEEQLKSTQQGPHQYIRDTVPSVYKSLSLKWKADPTEEEANQ